MDKQTIMVTGAASGIGRETALLFAEKGWFIGIFDVNEAGLEKLEAKIGSSNCFARVMDVTDMGSVREGIEDFSRQTGGRLDVLLNNAGILKFGFFENVDLNDHHRIIEVNLKGCLNCIYYGLPYLKKTPGSRIINMSSASSIYGVPDFSVYSATKHALSAMTEALDIELERYGIHVCDIKPPYVNTPILDSEEEIFSIQKMGVNLQPRTIAETVWKAAHGKKLHWHVGATHMLAFFFWLLPFARRFIVKKLTIPKK